MPGSKRIIEKGKPMWKGRKEMKTKTFTYWFLPMALFGFLVFTVPAFSGELEPTATPEPTMHTLDEIYNSLGGGVTEINQAKALAGGVTAGDAAGFPVTISESGSYRLTSDLVQSDANTHVIQVTSDHVTIDLNGFSIRGSNDNTVTLTGNYVTAVTCSGAGTGGGIRSDNFFTRVRNGTVTGIASIGIRLDHFASVADVILKDNCGRGLEMGYNALARHVIAMENASYGIYLWDRSIVEASTASDNGATGVYINRDSVVRHSSAYRNRGAGIDASFRSIVDTCTTSLNNADGVIARGWVRIIDCNINLNDGRPISTPGQDNNAYSGCNINDNAAAMGPQVVELPPNNCDGNTICP